jgi:hypothetical protein
MLSILPGLLFRIICSLTLGFACFLLSPLRSARSCSVHRYTMLAVSKQPSKYTSF